MRAALAAIFLAACAAPSSGEYHQSAFPPAPTFNPAWDAPHAMGQPGYVGEPEEAPRSPYTRTLPQTPETRKEAGIWAAKGDDGKDGDEFVLVLGIALRPATVNAEARTAAGICADSLNAAAKRVGRGAFPQDMAPAMRRCIASRLMWQCTDYNLKAWKHLKSKALRADAEWERAWSAALAMAEADVKRECKGVPTETPDDWHQAIILEWVKPK